MSKRLLFALVAVLTVICPTSCAAVKTAFKYDNAVNYREGEKSCVMDIASPSGAKDLPVIVWFHGGGLTGGCHEVPQELLDGSCVVMGVEYRLSPKVSVPEIIDDAAAAVAWAFAHASEYGGSPEKIYIAGHSAGGYLVDMIGLDRHWLAAYGVDADSLAAIVPYSGQVITHFELRRSRGIDPLTPVIDEYAPLYHVRGDCAPVLVISGDAETELYGRYEETAYFVRMLRLRGHKDVTFHKLDGFDHSQMVKPGHSILLRYIHERESKR